MNFEQLNLIPQLLTAVSACGYDEPTPIQRETIPAVLDGRDVLGCAQTGTGKTAAFALPMLQRLSMERKQHAGKRTIRALILTPTRELALQIHDNFTAYGKELPLRCAVIFGGVNQQPQVQELKAGVDILVATPGRLGDLINQGFITLEHIEIFVLDEADRMLDMGFIHDVRRIIALLPQKRQTLFFSATMPPEVEKLAMGILSRPHNVKVDPVTSTVDAIDQCVYMIDKANKKLLLAELLGKPEVENALVFSRTKHGADRVVRELARMNVPAVAIHGDKSQAARQEALMRFKSGGTRVLIATDIAARGIDIAGLSHVINYDLPNEPEAYIHRIGRTGRAGLEGTAISFCCIDEMKELYAIEKLIGKHIPRKESAWPMQVFEETVKQPRPPRPGRGAPATAAVADVNRDGSPKAAKAARGDGARRGSAQAKDARGGSAARSDDNGSLRGGSAARSGDSSRGGSASRGGSSSRGGDPGRGGSASRGEVSARNDSSSRGGNTSRNGSSSRGDSSAQPAAPSRASNPGGVGEARVAATGRVGAPRQTRFGPKSAQTPEPARASRASDEPARAMRATPLERPTRSAPARRAAQLEARDSREPRETDFRDVTAPRESYHEPPETNYVPIRKTRRPLSTGQDRK